MQRDPRELLYDVKEACGAIREFCAGHNAADYSRDRMLRSACERQFEIVGEAMSRLRDRHPATFAQIELGREIIAFRNRLIHGYDSVDSEIVWDVIQHKLPALDRRVAELLVSADPGE